MKVLVACEESQRVTMDFRKLGHEAYSCDLLDCPGIAKAMATQWGSEESIKDTIIADDNIAYQTAKVTKTKHSVLDIMQCKMCPADREGNRCGGKQCCRQTWERYAAIVNPEWHHVNLATLANIDFDMLDVKRQIYFNLNKDFKKMCNDLRKCKRGRSFDARLCNFRAKLTSLNTYEKFLLTCQNILIDKYQ